MGTIRLPMGVMNATIKGVTVKKDVLTVVSDVGTAPNYIGKVEFDLLPSDFRSNLGAMVIWVITRLVPELLLRAIGWRQVKH